MRKYLLIFSIASAISCNKPCINIHDDVISEYSVEEIKFFYETVLFSDRGTNPKNISRWYHDVYLYLDNYKDFELENVEAALAIINALSLPIKYHITESKKEAHITISFIDGKSPIQKKNSSIQMANVWVDNRYGRNTKGRINVFNRENNNFTKGVILEELIQSLGLLGDNYHYPNSIFYDEKFKANPMTVLDKRIVQLLLLKSYS